MFKDFVAIFEHDLQATNKYILLRKVWEKGIHLYHDIHTELTC